MFIKIISDRGKDICRRLPDVTAAVPVEVHGILEITRRHELQLPHCTSPGATHLLELDVPSIEDIESAEKFLTEEIRAARVPG